MPAMAKSDPFWLDPADPHRKAYTEQTLFGPTIPVYEALQPGHGEGRRRECVDARGDSTS